MDREQKPWTLYLPSLPSEYLLRWTWCLDGMFFGGPILIQYLQKQGVQGGGASPFRIAPKTQKHPA